MRHVHAMLAAALVAMATGACESNPPLGPPAGSGPGQLSAELVLSTGHIHTLGEIAFTVTIADEHGDPFNDFERVAVERRLVVEDNHGHGMVAAEDEPWRGTDLEFQGSSWSGVYTFTTSGEYEMRVVGELHGVEEPVVLYEAPDPAHVVRTHVVVGGYRIEFESFPGHLHAGRETEMRFWILTPDKNEAGIRTPIEGLDVEIHCNEAAGFNEEHHGLEIEPGVYATHHHMQGSGDFRAEIHFIGADAHEASAEFVTHVVAPH